MNWKGSNLRYLSQQVSTRTKEQHEYPYRRVDDRAEILTQDSQEYVGRLPTARRSNWVTDVTEGS